MRGRIAAELVDAVAARRAVDPTAAFDELVLDLRPLRGEEHLVIALCPHHCLSDDHVRAGERLVGAETLLHFLGEGDRERISLDARSVAA